VTPVRSVTVSTHARAAVSGLALARLIELAAEAGVTVRIPPDEVDKHGLGPTAGVELGANPKGDTDLAVVLGGDGSILTALRRYAGSDVPVFALNFGEIGFLATVEPGDLDAGIRRALEGDYETLPLPALLARAPGDPDEALAVNDLSFHRRVNARVAELSYSVSGEQLGAVRCDGLVVSTPAGSTGYNLANGGPVLAWGVKGFVVSFIAPHTLTARSLVVAPGDVLEVMNASREEPVDMTADGREDRELAAGDSIQIRFEDGQALLAQAPGATFYNRLRDKFGRLAS
jgi:NAD+ kinase